MRDTDRPNVVIIGGGFGGIAAAQELAGFDVDLVVLDRENHHVFQPLLYQVATASLSPQSISKPIRSILRDQMNCDVALANVRSIDPERRVVEYDGGTAAFDYLVVAAGARHDYFGHDDWEARAPGLKSLADATELRRRILLAFETAEHERDEGARRGALTFVIVGAGPTGVELAGAIKEIAGRTLPREYRNIDTTTARVVLVEGGPRVLSSFPDELSVRAVRDLERIGVEVRTGMSVTDVTETGILVNDDHIEADNIFWAAGVKASPLAESLRAPVDDRGRVIVEHDLRVPGHPRIFAIGDMASFTPAGSTQPLPGVAQVAIQMGRHAGMLIRSAISSSEHAPSTTFVYRDRGSMAVIGKNRAVAVIGSSRFTGFFAWILWATVHIAFLVSFRNRVRVLYDWAMSWLFNARDARVIIGEGERHDNNADATTADRR